MDATSTHNEFACLDKAALFADLPTEAKVELSTRVTHASYPKGAIIVSEGDPIERVVIVDTGRIKLYHDDANGEQHVLDVLHDGQGIWSGVFLDKRIYHYSVACLTKAEIYFIRRADFEAVLEANPRVALSLVRLLSKELDESEERVLNLSVKDPRRRLAEYLLRRDERCIGPDINLKLDDIARSVGLRSETVSRVLTTFEREGMVTRLGRGKLRVNDRGALGAVSNL